MAIANSRLVDFSDGRVAFRWKDCRHDGKLKVMGLPAAEFTRRCVLHVLPRGLQRIRHYGLLANRTVKSGAQQIRVTVAKEAAWAGVDPYNKRVERDSDDNLKVVTIDR